MSLDRRTFAFGVAASTVPPGAAAASPGLDGTWQGELVPISGPGIAPPPSDFGLIRVQIDNRNVRVFSDGDEVKPGTFIIERNGTNAVIFSIQSDPGAPQGRSWVETWAFIVTTGDSDTLLVNYVRVVNNNPLPASEDGARFTQIRTGTLRRLNV